MKSIIHKVKRLFSTLFGKKRIIRLGIYGETNTGKTTLANKISMDWLGEPVGTVSEMPHETRMIQKKEHVEVKASGKKLIINLLDMPGLATQIDYRQFMKFEKKSEEAIKLNDFRVVDLKKIAKEKSIEVSGEKANIVNKLKTAVKEEFHSELPELMKKLNIPNPKKKKKKKYTKVEARSLAEEATKGVVEAIKWLDNVDTVLVLMDASKDPLTQVNIMLIGNLEAKGIPLVIIGNKIDKEKASLESIRNAFPQHPVVGISALKGQNLNQLYEAISTHSV